jgi:hypothetical protein
MPGPKAGTIQKQKPRNTLNTRKQTTEITAEWLKNPLPNDRWGPGLGPPVACLYYFRVFGVFRGLAE